MDNCKKDFIPRGQPLSGVRRSFILDTEVLGDAKTEDFAGG